MMDRGKISPLQMAFLLYPVVAATGDLIVPAITATAAKRDMWLSPIWSSLAGFLLVFVAYRLNKLFPQETFIQYSQHILGRIPGMAFGFLYIFVLLYDTGFILREYADFLIGSFFGKTPMTIVLASMVAVCAFAVHGGVEVLGRAAQVIMPVVVIVWIAIVVLLIPDYKIENMFPVMENGIGPSLKGAITPEVWFCLFFLTTFLFPALTQRQKGLKWGMIAVLCVMLMLSLLNMAALLLFGDIAGNLEYPLMIAARYVRVTGFLEHLESLTMAVWVASVFVKLSVFYYATVLGTAQLLNLSNYKPVILPIGMLIVIFSIWSFASIQEMGEFSRTTVPLYENAFYLVIPVSLLLLAQIKSNR
ncbi:GerAB/ArcD/ProY family transporter [Gordoniibacillus kamchatkensis]|uniref:GerAB/ArcD/ProY family transporter n=1 Tax=Gordoniibacillus kamchatkensis TaxID=1590651 RepID=UPI000696B32D|nr:endospore germination permease [Paenibacillus sp. VKM B-2647]